MNAFGATVNYAPGSATDNVGVTSLTYSQGSGTVFPLGTTTVTITATDAANNAGTGTFTVSVVDTTAPVVTPPANVTAAATSAAGAVITYGAASISDAVGFTSVTYSQASGSSFPIGATTVTVTAKDAANNTGTATFTVTVTASTPAQYWRYAHFGTLENAGDAADSADPDHDGIPNVLELAFGTDPLSAASGPAALQYAGSFAGGGTIGAFGQPIARFESITNGIDFRALFVRRTDFAALGLTYVVEFSATLGTWQASTATPTVLADDGTMQIVSMPYPIAVGGKKARYFRVRVTSAP